MHNKSKYGRHFPQTAVPCSQEKSTVFSTSPITIATVHEIHLQLVFFVVIVALYHLFCKLFFLFFNCIFVCKHRLAIFDKFLQRHCLVLIRHTLFIIFRHVILCSLLAVSLLHPLYNAVKNISFTLVMAV